MITQKVQGRTAYNVWYTMSMRERYAFVEKIVQIEKTIFDIEFPANGSLYYSKDLSSKTGFVSLPRSQTIPEAEQLCVGPSTRLGWWYRGRGELPVHKGPCKSNILATWSDL